MYVCRLFLDFQEEKYNIYINTKIKKDRYCKKFTDLIRMKQIK